MKGYQGTYLIFCIADWKSKMNAIIKQIQLTTNYRHEKTWFVAIKIAVFVKIFCN